MEHWNSLRARTHTRWGAALLGAALALCAAGCADIPDDTDGGAGTNGFRTCQGPLCGPPPSTIVLHCGGADASCYECGNSNGVMCCLRGVTCTVTR